MRPGLAAENAIFVLQPDRAGAARLDPPGGVAIVGDAVEADGLDVVGIGHVGAVIDRIMVEDQRRDSAARSASATWLVKVARPHLRGRALPISARRRTGAWRGPTAIASEPARSIV